MRRATRNDTSRGVGRASVRPSQGGTIMADNATPAFDGDTYDDARDGERLARALAAVRDLMLDGEWRSLAAISATTGFPEASVSARLRDLRKEKFGRFTVDRRYVADGLWEYHVARPELAWACTVCGTKTAHAEPRLGGYGIGPCSGCGKRTMMRSLS